MTTGPTVTLLGDSIVAGYGLRAADALPARLRHHLQALGFDCRVRDAGVSGDTTADGLRRLERAVSAKTDLCVVALGANDLMQARAPHKVQADLEEIVLRLRSRPVRVLLCGMRAPPWIGDYARAFDDVFPAVATAHDIPLLPFLLEGVALNPALNLADRIHPNPRGVEIIARNLAPAVVRALS